MTVDAPIIALTPSLALDRTLELASPLAPGELHRVQAVHEVAGGKGVNLARTIRALGGEAVVAGFPAGWNGRKFRELLSREGLTGIFHEIEGEMRECQILLEDGHPTEVYESGPEVSPEDWRALVQGFPAGPVVVSGSLPPGITPELFRDLLQEFPCPPVVDTSGPALAAALEAGVALIKPNRSELAQLSGCDVAGISEAKRLFDAFNTPILFTQGAEGAVLIGPKSYRARSREIPVRNPVGSGDSLLGAFLWARTQGWTPSEALRLGVAAGGENARRGGGGQVTPKGIWELFEQVRVDEVAA